MKQHLTLSQLAAQLEANAGAKADYIAPAGRIEMADDLTVSIAGTTSGMDVRPTGHQQLAEFTGVPKPYYDRLAASQQFHPLLAANVNEMIRSKGDERRMVRTLNGSVRALLSDRYQRIDNESVAEVALDVLSGIGGVRVVSSAVTDSRMYIKAVSDRIQLPVPGSRRVGDLVEAGVLISNSEIGSGSVSIKPFANFLICTNGMVRESSLRQAHVGRKADSGLEGLLSDGTRRLEDEVVLRKVRDVLASAFDGAAFQRFIDRLTATTTEYIEGDVPAAIETLGPALGLTGGERSLVLRHLIEGGDLSRYGLVNAITRTGEDVDSYDRATELETLGFKLVELPATNWKQIANAKALA